MLKAAREAKGLTLDIVHEATKIPMDALKAIEQGYSVRSLTPFYYRGFVKIYAEFLGIDANEMLKAQNAERAAAAASAPSPTVKSRVLKPPFRPAASSAVKPAASPSKKPAPVSRIPKEKNPAFEQFQIFINDAWKPKNRALLLRVAGALLAVFIFVKFTGCVVNAIKNRPKTPAKVKVVKAKPVEKAPVVQLKPKPKPKPVVPVVLDEPDEEQQAAEVVPAAVVPVEPEQKVKAQSNSHKVELTVRAVKNSWIQVKTDGKVVFAMTMSKGTVEAWSARDQIELSGKSINELELEVNGRSIGSLGSNERKAKRVVITKDGLTVKK